MSTLKLSNKIGKLGEEITIKKLISQHYQILHRNWLEKTGEIDIVAEKDKTIHFVEVKSVSCENLNSVLNLRFKPEENMHSMKLSRLQRTIELYIAKNTISSKLAWQIDLYCVYLDTKNKKAKIKEYLNLIQ